MRKILSGLQEAISNNKLMVVLILFLFLFRLVYGLFAEFWFEDELQIYLIGLKSYTTGTWPFFGPDVVYTETQIPGALQALLISVPLKILAIPESPTLFLNILSFISLLYFAYYIHKRIPTIPFWLSTSWIMFLSWSMDYGTRVVNPSYVLVFSIPFFIALFELLPIYSAPLFSKKIAYLLVGSFIYVYFKNKAQGPWLIIKRLALFMYILVFLSFFFSIKGPSSHTFFLVFPVIVFYSFYCHAYLLEKFTLWKKLMYGALFSCIFFYAAIANYNFTYKSMYKNRSQVEKAITHKDYKILGTRRSEAWKNGY